MDDDGLIGTRATVGLVTAAWGDLDRLMSHVPDEVATAQPGPGRASVAWTVAHLSNQVDDWINVRFGGRMSNAFLSDRRWRIGSDGSADDWAGVRRAASEVRAAAIDYLAGVGDQDLDRATPYDGSMSALAGRAISLRYAISRVVAHTYFHVGALTSDLVATGLDVGEYPGTMAEALVT